jgi:hypothetical protein
MRDEVKNKKADSYLPAGMKAQSRLENHDYRCTISLRYGTSKSNLLS